MILTSISARLDRIESLIKDQRVSIKEVVSLTEASEYLGISKSHLYKLTSSGRIPFYKPSGKRIYFKVTELNDWLLSNRVESISEVEQKASNYLIKNGRIKL